MPVFSQNGYTANDRTVIASYTVPGTALKIALRKGDVSVVLLEYLRRYNLEVEPLTHNPQDLWGYAERTIRGSSTTLSNHASGSACDARATAHPLGVKGTITPAAKLAALNNLLAWFEGVIRHGKDYSGRVDEMHAEINAGSAQVARIANKIRGGASSTPPSSTQDWFDMATKDDLVAALHEVLDPVIWQTTGTLPNRRGPNGEALPESAGPDTLWGYAMNADGFGYRIEQALDRIEPLVRGDTPAPLTLADLSTPDLLAELGRRMTGVK